MKKCSYCGRLNQDTVVYCLECGTQEFRPYTEAERQKDEERKRKTAEELAAAQSPSGIPPLIRSADPNRRFLPIGLFLLLFGAGLAVFAAIPPGAEYYGRNPGGEYPIPSETAVNLKRFAAIVAAILMAAGPFALWRGFNGIRFQNRFLRIAVCLAGGIVAGVVASNLFAGEMSGLEPRIWAGTATQLSKFVGVGGYLVLWLILGVFHPRQQASESATQRQHSTPSPGSTLPSQQPHNGSPAAEPAHKA